MYCKKCGSQINDDAVFCKKCGTPINVENKDAETTNDIPVPNTKPNKKRSGFC